MLKKIRSIYIMKKLFLCICDKQKIKLIKYNKTLQNDLNININNYKHFAGRYIIYESNRIGKEYDGYDDTFKFEGEYLNGERNGKGKEYSEDGNLIFEGEYLNGKRNGKGKEYNEDGELLFEGEYINNKKSNEIGYEKDGKTKENNINEYSKGKEYDYSHNLKFLLQNSNSNLNIVLLFHSIFLHLNILHQILLFL